jgi:hypothetical protein
MKQMQKGHPRVAFFTFVFLAERGGFPSLARARMVAGFTSILEFGVPPNMPPHGCVDKLRTLAATQKNAVLTPTVSAEEDEVY